MGLPVNLYVVLGSAVVGLLVGMTGAGGGALMTPMLILLFSVKPAAAISSDLVAAVVMRPVGAAVHFQRGTVNTKLVLALSAGSVPAAFGGAYALHLLSNGKQATHLTEVALGAALLVGAGAMVLRFLLDRKSGNQRDGDFAGLSLKPAQTVAIGVLGGAIVGITSVGAGSLMIVLLMFLYPTLSAKRLVGTDLTQAIPLTASAALGALAFGHVQMPVTSAVILGSVPAVLVGSLLASRFPDRHLRPVITFVILASGLKYVGVDAATLGVTLGVLVATGAMGWLAWRSGWILGRRPKVPVYLE
jgi:uncharacterized protein